MKKLLAIFLFLLWAAVGFSQQFDAEKFLKQKPPEPQKLVNDFTNTLTHDQVEALERKLVAFDDSTSTQIAVIIIPTINGNDIADYNVKLFREWGVGGKERNNGVLLLVAKDDRKLNITTGYGVEGALPDITSKHIIDEEIVPIFKRGNYYGGIDQGTDAIMQAVKGEYTAPENYRSKGKNGVSIGRIIFIILIIIFILARGGGKGGGSFMSRRGFTAWTIGNLLSNTGGGSSWGGGGSSGGFGGFGGGSSGGGGASGSW